MRRRSSLLDTAAYLVGRSVLGLPAPLLGRVAGPAVAADGPPLDRQMQVLLALRARVRGAEEATRPPPAKLRRRRHAEIVAAQGPAEPVAVTRDLSLPTRGEHRLVARLYEPPPAAGTATPGPLLVYFHGGGMVFGDVDTHDRACRIFCARAAVTVLSVEYRLAPEHPCPAAAEDATDAFRWAVAEAARLGVDPARIAVGGDSAGGNLAAVVAQATVGDRVRPSAQVLIYPAVDRTRPYPSLERFAAGFLLETEEIAWYHAQYTAESGLPETDPRVSPACGRLEDLPRALVVTAGFDPLRDEGEAYADALRAAGTPVTLHRYADQIHGFLNLGGVSGSARAAIVDLAARMRPLLHGAPR